MKSLFILAVIYQVVSGLPKFDYNYQAPPSHADGQGSTKITHNNLPSNQSQSHVDSHPSAVHQSEIPGSILKTARKSEEASEDISHLAKQASPAVTTETATTVLDTTTTKSLLDRIRDMFQQSRKKLEDSLSPATTTLSSATTTKSSATTIQSSATTKSVRK